MFGCLNDGYDIVHRVLDDALRQLVGGYAVDDYDESAVGGAHESEEEPGIHFADLSCSPCDVRSAVSG